MDKLESMAVFRAVAKAGSLSGAGRELDMPLATVSRKLAELETHLNARLLHRSTRQLRLTDTGRAYLDACSAIFDQIEDAEQEAAGEYREPQGELIITAPVVFGRLHVLPLILAFLEEYPEVNVRLVLGNRNLNLIEDHIDLAIRIGELADSDMIATKVGNMRHVVCASPDYLSHYGTPRSVDDLRTHRCITFESPIVPGYWVFGMAGETVSVPIRSRLMLNSAEAAVDSAVAGFGITRVLYYQMEEAQRRGALKIILHEHEPRALPISLLYNRQGRLPQKLRAFLDFAVPKLRERCEQFDRR